MILTSSGHRDPSRRPQGPACSRRRTVVHACHHDHGPALDRLTGLSARDALEALLTLDAKTAASSMACVLVDLVGLKQTNILHGFTAGDALLRRAADRLRALASDARLLARLGGDELVAVFVGPTAAARAAETSAAAAAPETPPLRAAWTELREGEPPTELFDRLYAAARRGD
ncbi:MAG: diguanylate cyclase [Planctomycetota bacterium]|nr:diguanylate cyclase [Planctomycetota bacterium]